MDSAVKILADFIVEEKTAVIIFLNEEGYADLPLDAYFIEINEAVSKHILDEKFVKKLGNLIFPYKNEAGEGGGGGGSASWVQAVLQVLEISAGLIATKEQEETKRLTAYALNDLEERKLRDQTELAKIKAQEDFAFDLVKAQRDTAQDNTSQNIILLLGVVGFLVIAFYAVKRNNK